MPQELYLPDGFYSWAILYAGAGLPRGAVTSGCGVNTAAETPTGIATDLIVAWTAQIMPLLTDDVTMIGCYVRIGETSGTGPSVTQPADVDGASTSAPAPPNLTYLARLGTAIGGKRGRGRWYLPGVGEDKVDGAGTVVGTFVTAANTALLAVLAYMDAQNEPLAIGHRYDTPFPGDALPPSEIVSAGMDNRAATQRRRLR